MPKGSPTVIRMLYKVLPQQAWRQAQAAEAFSGSGIDVVDGFIHLSSAEQVVETVAKHFAGHADLILVWIDEAKLGDDLRWEPSRGGQLFPHVYGVIPMNAIVKAEPLPLRDDGRHEFPEL